MSEPSLSAAVFARIERWFEAWGSWVIRWRWSVAVVPILATALLAGQIPNLRTDNSPDSFLLPQDPARVAYDAFRAQFGHDAVSVIGVEGPELFDLGFLQRLKALHTDLEERLPYVDEVTSLINVRSVRGDGDRLIVQEFLEDWPSDSGDLEELRARALANPLYVNTVLNRSGTLTLVIIEPMARLPRVDDEKAWVDGFDSEPGAGTDEAELELRFLSDEQEARFVEVLLEVIDDHEAPDFRLTLSSDAYGAQYLSGEIARDQRTFLPITVALNALLLAGLFRRFSGALLPLVVALLGLASTFGVMAVLDVPNSAAAGILPALILCVGFCNAIHLLTIVYQLRAAGESRDQAIARALGHSGLPVLMTSLTTAGGLASFLAAQMGQVQNIGIVAPIGIMLTFVYSVTVLPALLAILPLPVREGASVRKARSSRWLAELGCWAARRPGFVLMGTAPLLAVAGVGFAQLGFSQNPIRWFPAEDPQRRAVEYIDDQVDGVARIEVVIDTGRENGLLDPESLRRIDAAGHWAAQQDHGLLTVGKAVSVVDIVRETHQALNENQPAFYVIPDDSKLLAQELLLFESGGSGELESLVDPGFRLARLSLSVPYADGGRYAQVQPQLREKLGELLGDGVDFQLTGNVALSSRSFELLNSSMVRSYIMALSIISPLVILVIGNLRRGLLAMLPNLLPVYLTLGLMGALGIPLDTSTLLIGCIIIGLAVDDTIHFVHKFQRYHAAHGDVQLAIRNTLETTGVALLFTTLVLAAGFSVMGFAYMINLQWFALLSTVGAISALAADVILTPALLSLATKDRGRTAGLRMRSR